MIFVLTIISYQNSFAQSLGDIRITPTNPTENNVVYLEIFAFSCDAIGLESLQINGFDIDMTVVNQGCFIGVPTPPVWHQFEIGQLAEGEYIVTIDYRNQIYNETLVVSGSELVAVTTLSISAIVILTLIVFLWAFIIFNSNAINSNTHDGS